MDRQAKEKVVAELKELFSNSSAAVLVDTCGLESSSVMELRTELHQSGSRMKVVKNTLARIAAKGTPFESMVCQFERTKTLILHPSDPISQAKILAKFAKSQDKLSIYSGLLVSGDRADVLTADQIEELAKLPSKEELIVKLLFVLNAPITQFVRTINEVPSSFVRVLSAIAESKK